MDLNYCTENPVDQRYDYDIPGYETSDEGFILYVRIRSVFLYIHVLTQKFHRSPIAVEAAQTNADRFLSDNDQDELWEYLEDIASHFLPALRELAPTTHYVGKVTLADLSVRQLYKCELEFHNEIPRTSAITPMDPEEEGPLDDCYDEEQVPFDSPFPSFQLSDVEVDYDESRSTVGMVPTKVFVHGKTLFWKSSWASEESRASIEKYAKIYQSGLSHDQLSTSRLYGVVKDKRGSLRGQLYHWIDIKSILTWNMAEQASKEVREKWASQIQSTVSTLHKIAVVWGDVKNENVVIDQNGNAIVIDLEGGATRGWIEKKVMDTKEGDLQGLDKLMDFIFDDNCHLRQREKKFDLSCNGCEL